MTNEELCKALRSALWGQGNHINIKAADRIEALLDERDKLLGAQILDRSAIRLQKQKREAAEAALKEAVGVIQSCPPTSYPHISPSAHLDNINTWWRIWVRPFLAKHGSQK